MFDGVKSGPCLSSFCGRLDGWERWGDDRVGGALQGEVLVVT